MKSPRTPASRHSQNSGVVLIVVMVMLVIIGFMSVAVMRGAMNSDQISNNNRAQIQASEAAQLALRFCEAEIIKGTSTLITIAASPVTAAKPTAQPLWKSKDLWTSTTPGSAVEIPADALKTSNMSNILKRPQCLAEYADATVTSPIVLTARGFSADYSENSTTNKITSGSVVWLQSTFVISQNPSP
jgi:type IV pilus assembly protein PilX